MESSPRDLSVLFRSLERRQREALHGLPPDHDDLRALTGDIRLHVSAAARVAGTGTEPEQVAEGLVARPASGWTDAELEHLREIGLQLGRLLRELAQRAEEVRERGDA